MRRNAWIGVTTFWLLFGLLSGIQVWISMITHGHSMPRLVGFYIALWAPWIAFSGFIVRLSQRWPVSLHHRADLSRHLGAASVMGIAHGSLWIALTIWLQPFDRMTGVFSRLDVMAFVIAQLPLELILYAAVLGIVHAAGLYRRYREREVQTAQLESSLATARLQALELQIQPHFLFNTLNAISSLVRSERQAEAMVMIAGLSDLLRYTLEHAGDQSVTLDQEGGMLRRYLEIQRTRFPDRLAFTVDIAGDAGRACVPTLILQPLAENAISHGIATSAGPGQVLVRAYRDEDNLHIEMFNSGSLRDGPEGIGLRNTRERLHRMYGGAHRFDLRQRGDGVMASLSIPWKEAT